MISCYLCGKKNDTFLFHGEDRLFKTEGVFRVVKCNSCGLVYLNPRPTFQSMADYYPPEYYDITMPNRISPSPDGFRNLVTNLLAMAGNRGRIKSVEKNHILDRQTKLLDLGCGNGNFLYALKEKKGCEVAGVEFCAEMAKYCSSQLGLDVREGVLLENRFADGCFDVVTMWHYFEHEFNPLGVLWEVRRILKDDGLVVMEIPTIDCWPAKLFKSKWFPLEVPRHVVHYSPKTIERILNKAGFKLIDIEYPSTPGYTSVALFYALGLSARNFYKGSKPNKVKRFIYKLILLLLFFLTLPLEILFVTLKQGDIIKVFASPVQK